MASRDPSRKFRDSSRNQTGTKFSTCKDAGIPQGCCIRCASNQHKMSDPSCIYADTPLPNSGCRRCLKGGAHYSRYCKFPKDNNISSSSRPPLVLHQGFHKEGQDFPKEGHQWQETILQPEKLMKINRVQKKK